MMFQTSRFILDAHYALSDNWSVKGILTHEDTDVDREFGIPGMLEEFDGLCL